MRKGDKATDRRKNTNIYMYTGQLSGERKNGQRG